MANESAAKGTGKPSALVDTRVIYCGDNLDQLEKLPEACVDLIYVDPPFNSNRNYEVFWGDTKEKRAFEDRHASTQAYIEFMRPRCVELARVLKKTGSFYYHCDWHASHYVKVMLDHIFGENNFQNEIIWKRTSARSDSHRYNTIHDTILFYTASPTFTWNPQYQPYDEDYLDEFYTHVDSDGRRWKRGDLTSPNPRPNMMYTFKGYPSPKKGWRFTKERLEELDREGKIHYPKDPEGVPRLKSYLDEMPGVPLQSVWTDIRPLHNLAAERLGYPTQKPLGLLERIVKSSSNPNDIVLDAFCGCGTALVAAQNLGRQWIGIDISPTACRVMAKRLHDVCKLREDENHWRRGRGFVVRNLPWTEKQLREIPPFEFENWAVIALGGIPDKAQVGDMGIDGRIYPLSAVPHKSGKAAGELDFMDEWYPIQVKQGDKVGRPDIDRFEAAMIRAKRKKGFFVGFDFSHDALAEIGAFFKAQHTVIVPLTVREILDEQIAQKLA
jgi:DNA modification methylase